MAFTLRKAGLHSPKAMQNRIVRQLAQMDENGRLVANDFFPLVELSDTTETYFRQSGKRSGMQPTALAAESPVGAIEGLTEDDVTVDTYKKKMAPEKGVNTELNSQGEILNLFNATEDALREDLMITREEAAWRAAKQPGLIGQFGDEAHPAIHDDHILTPSTAYSDTANASPVTDFVSAETEVSDRGVNLEQTSGIQAAIPTRVIKDLKLNDDILENYQNTRVLDDSQLATEFQIDGIVEVRSKVPRKDADGNLIDEEGNPVEEPEDAVMDNVLEPWDPAAGRKRRNIVIGAFDQVSAFMPYFSDRLAEHAEGVGPMGDFSVDSANGFVTQTWTTPDPVVSWFKIMQEIGMHVEQGGNFAIIQDI